MEQRLVATRQILSENDNLLTLQYFLLKERSPSRKQKFGAMILERNSGEKALAQHIGCSGVPADPPVGRLYGYSNISCGCVNRLGGDLVRRQGGISRIYACECMYGYDLPRI